MEESIEMRKFIGLALFVCLVALAGFAQETPKPEVFGGYQFTHLDPSWNASGWNGAANMYINRWLGVTGDFSGAYKTGTSFYTYTGGPVVSMHKGSLSPFAHGLFGGGHASASGVGTSGFVMMFGGGVDMGNKQLAFRLFQFDWMSTRFSGFTDNNNVRVSTGVLFRF
jgi:hypothetical protein